MTTTWPLQSDLAAMHAAFGNPDSNNDGAADRAWVLSHLAEITPPYPVFYNGKPVRAITCNRAIAAPLLASLQDVLKHYGSPAGVAKVGMDRFDGCFEFRVKRGNSNSLSMHAYGCATDWNARDNPFQSKGGTMPKDVVDIFKSHGAIWGGDWSAKSRDPMHFQWARVR